MKKIISILVIAYLSSLNFAFAETATKKEKGRSPSTDSQIHCSIDGSGTILSDSDVHLLDASQVDGCAVTLSVPDPYQQARRVFTLVNVYTSGSKVSCEYTSTRAHNPRIGQGAPQILELHCSYN